MVDCWSPATVTLDVTAMLVSGDGTDVPVRAALRYHLSDPYAVHATFTAASDPDVTWVFARDLLTEGVLDRAGQGDVRVWRSADEDRQDVFLRLRSPQGQAILRVPGAALSAFLRRSFEQCWPGDEHAHLDTDRAIESLFAS
jgi:hypothetical protein